MINSYEFNIRILFKKFYCHICGNKLNIKWNKTKLTEEQKKIYYKELYPYGLPVYTDVAKVKQIFVCSKCDYYNDPQNQLLIRKKQKKLKKKILDENEVNP